MNYRILILNNTILKNKQVKVVNSQMKNYYFLQKFIKKVLKKIRNNKNIILPIEILKNY